MKKLRPVVKIHGGKYYLSKWIIDAFPQEYEKLSYIEPYCGGASVFMNKVPSNNIEIINDISASLMQIYRALRDEPELFIQKVKRTTYSERVFIREKNKQGNVFDDYLKEALNEYVVRRMSRGGLKEAFAWSDRERGGKPGDLNAWITMADHLSLLGDRIKKCYLLNKPALEIIEVFDSKNSLIYVDPPYDPEARVSKNVYENEMTTEDHLKLIELIKTCKSKVVISGYPSAIYRSHLKEWNCIQKKIANHSSQKKTKPIKTECLWVNY